jgi:hypothetical protein
LQFEIRNQDHSSAQIKPESSRRDGDATNEKVFFVDTALDFWLSVIGRKWRDPIAKRVGGKKPFHADKNAKVGT